jgi:hypothetical protein
MAASLLSLNGRRGREEVSSVKPAEPNQLNTSAPIVRTTRMKAVIDQGPGECIWQNETHPTSQ